MSLDLKDTYFHIQVAPRHRRFLRFAVEEVAYQYKVLPFGSHATHPFLAEAEGSIRSLVSRTPPRNSDLGLCISPGPLE